MLKSKFKLFNKKVVKWNRGGFEEKVLDVMQH